MEEVFDDQLACADLVVLSKADLLDAATLASVEERLRSELRPNVRVVRSRGADLAPAILIGLAAAAEDDLAARAGHHGQEEEHDHDDFDSLVVRAPARADLATLRGTVEKALAIHGVLRVKGYAPIAGKPSPAVVQAVGSRVELAFARPGSRTGEGLVVIGLKGFDRAGVEAVLAA